MFVSINTTTNVHGGYLRISTGILKSLKNRDSLYHKLRKTQDNSNRYNTQYTCINLSTCNNIHRKSIREAKIKYYLTDFNKYKSDSTKMWELLKDTLQWHKSFDFPSYFIQNNIKITDPTEIAEHFNDYFSSIGKNK